MVLHGAVLHAALQGMCIGLVPGVLRRFSVRCRKGPPSGDTCRDTGPVTQVVTQIYARSGPPHSGRRRQTGAPRPRRRTRAAGKGALAPIGCAGHVRGAGARPLGGRPPARVQKPPAARSDRGSRRRIAHRRTPPGAPRAKPMAPPFLCGCEPGPGRLLSTRGGATKKFTRYTRDPGPRTVGGGGKRARHGPGGAPARRARAH